jgi:haloalkane dehalogenase
MVQSKSNTSRQEMKVPDWVPQHLFPFPSRTIEIENCRVHYVDEGSGPVLLLLHGNPTWSFLYRDIIRGLKNDCRCIALDYPGFGLSKASDGYDFKPATHARIVEKFIEALNLDGILLMVQDWGGPLGLSVATRCPERFAGFIIGNTMAWSVRGDKHFEWFSGLMGGSVGGFLIRHFNLFVNLMIPAGTPQRRPNREIMRAYRGPFPTPVSREPTHIFPREIIGSSDFLAQVEGRLEAIRHLPALIIWGQKDFAFREKERQRFERIFQNSRTLLLEKAGHYIQEEASDEIVTAIKEWRKLG